MLTSALITMSQKEAPDWSRIQLLTFLNELQRMVFAQNTTSQMRIYDAATGCDPLLTGVAGQLVYDINTTSGFPNNAWRVCNVYADDIKNSLTNIITFDATPAVPYAKIVFPEAVSGSYYVRCYRFPTELTTELVQLEIPASYHLTHIYQGLLGLIEMSRSGRSDRWKLFTDKLLPELIKRISDTQSIRSEVTYSPCGL